MPQHTHYSPVAASYAEALLQLANADQQAEPVGQELAQVRRIIADNDAFRLFLADPAISQEQRGQVLGRVFEGNVSKLMHNFLGILNEKGRTGLLPEIAAAYHDLLNQQLNRIEVDVTVARELSADELEQVRQRVGEALKKDALVRQHVDESILGGLMLRVQDRLIDASVRNQLQLMRSQLMRPAAG
jgi:F-type H+-transporting ATPase subunit delta